MCSADTQEQLCPTEIKCSQKMWTHLGNFTFSESYILKSENKTGEIHFNNIYPNSSKILTFQCVVNIKNSNEVILFYFFILHL